MKKIVAFILTLVFIYCIFSACGESNTTTTELSNTASGDVQTEKTANLIDPSGTLAEGDMDVQGESMDASDSNTDAQTGAADISDSIAYIKYFNSYLPISCIKGGQQILTGDGGWYFDVESRLSDLPKADELQAHATVGMYAQGTVTPYDTLPQTNFIDSKVPGDSIAINGKWGLFTTRVRYESYTLENQPQNEDWYSYFSKKVHAVSKHTPVIITEAWFFDLNNDGIEEAFVNANNTFYSTEDNLPNPPNAQSSAVYSFSVLFVDGSEPLEMSTSIYEIGNEPVNDKKNIYVSYMLSDESPIHSEHFVTAVQYDAQGNLIECPIFNSGEYNRSIAPKIVIADIDGDGQAELITLHYSIYSPIIVYRIDDSGRLIESFRINTPA